MLYFVTNPDANTQVNNIYQHIKHGMGDTETAETLSKSGVKNLQSKGQWTGQQIEQIRQNFKLDSDTPLTISEEIYKEEQKKTKPSIILIILSIVIATFCILMSFSEALVKGLAGGKLGGYTFGPLSLPLFAVLLFQISPSFRNNRSRVKIFFWAILIALFLGVGKAAKRAQSLAEHDKQSPAAAESLDSIIEDSRGNKKTLEESLAAIDRLHEQEAASLPPIEGVIEQAEKGDIEAQLDLAERYSTGIGAEKDSQKGYEWYLEAAEQNNAEAQYWIANFYARGMFNVATKERNEQAIKWYTKAAKNCSSHAQVMLAGIYQSGNMGFPPEPSISPDIEKGIYWRKRAAMNKHGGAMSELGLLLLKGELLEKNEVDGLAWHYVSNELYGEGVYAEKFDKITKNGPSELATQARERSKELSIKVNNHQCEPE